MRWLVCSLTMMAWAAAWGEWQMNQFMISTWGGPENEAEAVAYVDAGFNTVMVRSDKLELCRAHGLRALVMDATPEMASQRADDSAVWGWYVRDEPPVEDFPAVAETVAAFHAADPNHPAYVNLMAWMPLDKYLETVKPRFLSYDYYQWWWGTRNYCWRLEVHREAALRAGLPLICWVEANADPRWEWGKEGATTLPDNAPKLRQSVYLALAYGVTGIQWFTAGLVFGNTPQTRTTLTKSGQHIRAINRDLQALGPVLLGLRSVGVYHTPPIPEHTAGVPKDLWVQARGGFMTLGLFEDKTVRRHLMVVNRDIRRERMVTLMFPQAAQGFERFGPEEHQWLPVQMWHTAKGVPAVRLRIGPGDAVLLRESRGNCPSTSR